MVRMRSPVRIRVSALALEYGGFFIEITLSLGVNTVADMAQVVEHILGKDEVPGSNPGISS